MKKLLLCILFAACPALSFAQNVTHQQGTIVRMRMLECQGTQHGFMESMSGNPRMDAELQCPEYVLVSQEVVYVISGKTSDQLLPLAEVTRFRFHKNEMLIRVDDAPKESHFRIKAMVMRPDWDRAQLLEQAAAEAVISQRVAPVVTRNEP